MGKKCNCWSSFACTHYFSHDVLVIMGFIEKVGGCNWMVF